MKTKEDSKKLKGKNKKKNNSEIEEIKALEAQYDSVSIIFFFLVGSVTFLHYAIYAKLAIDFIHSLHQLEYRSNPLTSAAKS